MRGYEKAGVSKEVWDQLALWEQKLLLLIAKVEGGEVTERRRRNRSRKVG
jgi:hypothetical protein